MRTDSLIELDNSLMSGEFLADSLHSESDLNLRNGAVFKNPVSLDSARIAGQVDLNGASIYECGKSERRESQRTALDAWRELR